MSRCSVTVSGGFTDANKWCFVNTEIMSSFHKAAPGIEGYLLVWQCLKRSVTTCVLSYRPKFVKGGSVRTGQYPVRHSHRSWNSGGLVAITGAALSQVACKNNIHTVYMHTRLFVNGVLRDFLKKEDYLTETNLFS